MDKIDWHNWSSGILKAELKRRNITYKQLSILLDEIGVKETQSSILNKMSRGSFQFIFFLQCAEVIGLTQLDLNQYVPKNSSHYHKKEHHE